MLFNSYFFIFLFLPVTLLGFHLIGSVGRHHVAIAWLVAASLFFYGWWNPAYLGLILASMLFNYAVGVTLTTSPTTRKAVLAAGIAANLGLLGYYKYANFFVDSINSVAGSSYTLETIILPLAISFFTFQQIAYLVDAYRGETHEYRFLHYALFVTFFPQLIAGPIVHHREMLPQFSHNSLYQLRARNFAIGLTIFSIGLFKKVVIADSIALYATPVFNAAESGTALSFFEAWGGALAYTFQLYFDFSGYSDMAIGVARMFGVRLPLNFNSPYKATSIIDFWRRWHITLSRFLRDYLYIPLGGNRKGEVRRLSNLMITMLLGGLWHGAGWTFVIWGGLHGLYLVINHGWRTLCSHIFKRQTTGRTGKIIGWGLTLFAVVIAWVPFRAESLTGATNMFSAMFGNNGFALPASYFEPLNALFGLGNALQTLGFEFTHVEYFQDINQITLLASLLVLACVFPNTQQIMRRYRPAFETYRGEIPRLRNQWLEWRPTTRWAIYTAVLSITSVLMLTRVSEFLYFQF